jgi:integrase
MATNSYGSGTIFQRGAIWWVQVCVDNKKIRQSSKSPKKSEAIKLRDKLLGKKHRREITGGPAESVLIGELLDDTLKSDIEESTRYIWKLVVEKNLRPFFGKIKAARLSTDQLDDYREKRIAEGRSHSTANRELSILRTAFHNGRKRSPPKVRIVPYFPMVKETTIRKGFLSDEIYTKLRDSLEHELKPLFVSAYVTGIRKGELLPIQWSQVDFDGGVIALERDETKGREARTVPILDGDMRDLLLASKKESDESWPDSPWVFNRAGERIKDFRGGWEKACKEAGVPDLNFHDLRRTAVRNMRRDGVPQVIRMKISGHKTDSMERRYNIVDDDDLAVAKEFMERGMKLRKSAAEV